VTPEHLEEIELATKRIEDAVLRLQHPMKGKEKPVAPPAAEKAEAARGHVA
jgi:hypothetical protein